MAWSLFESIGASLDELARRLVVFGLMVAAVVGAVYYYFLRDPTPAERMAKANPVWTINDVASPPEADDASGRGKLYLHRDDLGADRIERVDCSVVRAALPPWFELPDVPLGNCARLGPGGYASGTLVMNIVTPMRLQPMAKRWQAAIDRNRFVGSISFGNDGRRGRSLDADAPDPAPGQEMGEAGTVRLTIEPPYGSTGNNVRLVGDRFFGTTRLVITVAPSLVR